jgi:hypothetical protein
MVWSNPSVRTTILGVKAAAASRHSMVRLGPSKGRERMTHSQIEARFKTLESREEHVRHPSTGMLREEDWCRWAG